MKMRKTIVLIGLLWLLGGCLSQDERMILRTVEKTAQAFMEEKYNQSFEIERSGYIMAYSLFPSRTKDIYVKFTDGSRVVFYDEDKIMADDRQATMIKTALDEYFLSHAFGDLQMSSAWTYNEFHGRGEEEGSYYTTFFDGDVERFLEQEEVAIQGEITLVVEMQEFEAKIEPFLDFLEHSFVGEENRALELVFMDPLGLITGMDDYACYPDIEHQGYFVEYLIYDDIRQYKRHFIEVYPGIYACYAGYDDCLKEGDLVLKESDITEYQLIEMMRSHQKDARYQISLDSPVYVFERSDRWMNRDMSVYLWYDDAFYDGQFYYYPQGYGRGLVLAVTQTSAAYHHLEEKECFWFGYQERIGKNREEL